VVTIDWVEGEFLVKKFTPRFTDIELQNVDYVARNEKRRARGHASKVLMGIWD